MPKIQETKNGLFLYLPKQYTQLLAWKKGDILAIYPDNKETQTLIIRKIKNAEPKEKKETTKTEQTKPQFPNTHNFLSPEEKRRFILGGFKWILCPQPQQKKAK